MNAQLLTDQTPDDLHLVQAGSSLVDPDTGVVILGADSIEDFQSAVRAGARIHSTKAQAAALDEEIARLQARSKAIKRRQEWLIELYKPALTSLAWSALAEKYDSKDPEKWASKTVSFTYVTIQFTKVPPKISLTVPGTDKALVAWARKKCPEAIKPPTDPEVQISKIPKDLIKVGKFFDATAATQRIDLSVR